MRDEKVVVPVSNDVPSNTVELSSVLNVSKVVVLILSPERECINAVSSLRKIFVPNPAPSPTPIPINFLIKTKGFDLHHQKLGRLLFQVLKVNHY